MNLTEQAAKALAEIDEELAICEKATAGPWHNHYNRAEILNQYDRAIAECGPRKEYDDMFQAFFNGDFIASARAVCPKSLRCLKTAIEGLLEILPETEKDEVVVAVYSSLAVIIAQWNENK